MDGGGGEREGREGGGGWMKADETEKDWKRRCFNEQQLPICSGSLPRYVHRRYFTLQYYTGAPWARLGVAADVCEWGSGKYNE